MDEKEQLNNLLATLRAAQEGDLTRRVDAGPGVLGEVAQATNELLSGLEKRATQISYAATSIVIAAESASSVLPEIAEGMARQQAAVAEIARKLKALEARSEEIGQIVEMLDDVTSETNVLSLNAAIEASRAGSQGKGFGLVAEEVRKMAERSAVATKDIGAYIETIASATGDATRAIDSVRKMADQLASLTTRASNEATALAGSRKSLTEAIAQWRFVGQGETEITRILHERRNELTRVLGPLSPLVADTHTPLGEALRNLLAALGENPARPDSRD
jgi:methyl-accepting chemotaxis protein